MQRIRDVVVEIVYDLSAHTDKPEPELEADVAERENSPLAQLDRAAAAHEENLIPERWKRGKPVLCIPGMGLLDEAAAMMNWPAR